VNAGVIEDGSWSETVVGTPQGSASPLLANVYLHYVLDRWVRQWPRQHARGDMVIVGFADDFVTGIQHQSDARKHLSDLRERFAKFALELHPDKTRLIEFGRFAARTRVARGAGKPETFKPTRRNAESWERKRKEKQEVAGPKKEGAWNSRSRR